MFEFQINFLAVGAASLATLFIGALWCSPLMFGNLSIAAHGYSEETVERMRKTIGKTFLVFLVCYAVMAFVFSMLISYADVTTIGQGIFLGILIWVGFLATRGLTDHMVSTKSLTVYFIDGGFQFVYMILMSVILTAWR